ncbi:MAG TPA: hypothetical protein VMD55_07010 [Terracidiphilus sp.]|nr:hypothetical protein [Terracidiphilus sp.]
MRALPVHPERLSVHPSYVVLPSSSSLVEVLRSTLKQLEQNEDLASDDPALAELKGSILRTIAELEIGKTPKSPAQQRILWITPKPRTVQLDSRPDTGVDLKPDQSSDGGETLPVKTLAAPAGKASLRKPRTRTAAGRRSG